MRAVAGVELMSLGLLFLVLVLGLPHSGSCQPSTCNPHLSSPPLEKFVDALPIPTVINVSAGQAITLGAYKIKQVIIRWHLKNCLSIYELAYKNTCA